VKAVVIFGSPSDSGVYTALSSYLQELGMGAVTETLSAHRQPRELEEFLENEKYDVIFAGAGLAAHLPGVCASKTIKPVFGVPVTGAFLGLDAFLSIVQMPAGVPVLCTPVNDTVMGPLFCQNLLKMGGILDHPLHFIVGEGKAQWPFVEKELTRGKDILSAFGKKFTIGPVPNEKAINISLQLDLGGESEGAPVASANHEPWRTIPTITVPMMSPRDLNNPENALVLFKSLKKGGTFVGVNNVRNGVLMALRFMNEKGKYTALLEKYKRG
jgi:5-(carboxyamino)imidazole ribonucleotide mutase